jgi:hypothetical protein
MAGYVKADRSRIPGSTVLQVVARDCPVTHRYAEVCQQYDPHTGIVLWCPFMYGLRITREIWHRYEARTPEQAAALSATADDSPQETYRVMCLRQSSSDTEVGAIDRR